MYKKTSKLYWEDMFSLESFTYYFMYDILDRKKIFVEQ